MSDNDIKPVRLIVGLGNPGSKYSWTRHNVGFEVLDVFARQLGVDFSKESKFSASIAHKDLTITYRKKSLTENLSKSIKIICAMPQTFMNRSGTAVQQLSNYYKIPLENILVVHDDVALDTGKLRMAFNRGAGGQHGIEDIMAKFGGVKNFHRLKVGVGPDPGGDMRGDYVLGKFTNAEKILIEEAMPKAIKFILAWLLGEDHQQLGEINY